MPGSLTSGENIGHQMTPYSAHKGLNVRLGEKALALQGSCLTDQRNHPLPSF